MSSVTPARILMVDDEPATRAALAELLAGWGHRVEQADISCLNKIRQRNAHPCVPLGGVDDEPKIGADEPLPGVFTALAVEPIGNVPLLSPGEQRHGSNLTQVLGKVRRGGPA